KEERRDFPGEELHFSPDGNHYAYWKYASGAEQIVLDGVIQPASDLGPVNPKGFIFSPDSQHLAHFGVPPSFNGTYQETLFLDGKATVIGGQSAYKNLSFTADTKHIFWTQLIQNDDFRVYMDGKPVLNSSMAGNATLMGNGWWDMAPDGALMF